MVRTPLKERVGERFGILEIIDVGYRKTETKKRGTVTFKCDCGTIKTVLSHNVLNGRTKSCGCMTIEWKTIEKHGMHNSRIYQIHQDMKARCSNPKLKHYYRYGGRGIKVCEEWLNDFMNFYNWAMENGYSDSLTIDRIDSNGNYEPSNCKWSTPLEQASNRNPKNTFKRRRNNGRSTT